MKKQIIATVIMFAVSSSVLAGSIVKHTGSLNVEHVDNVQPYGKENTFDRAVAEKFAKYSDKDINLYPKFIYEVVPKVEVSSVVYPYGYYVDMNNEEERAAYLKAVLTTANDLLPKVIQKVGIQYTYQEEDAFNKHFTPANETTKPLWEVKGKDANTVFEVNTNGLYYLGKAGYDVAKVKVTEGHYKYYAIKDGEYYDTEDDAVLKAAVVANVFKPAIEVMNFTGE